MSTVSRIQSSALILSLCGLALSAMTGCSKARNAGVEEESEPRPISVRLDRSNNGAAINVPTGRSADTVAPPRELAFSVVGSAPGTEAPATMEAKAAASQAAILDAFAKALREARKSRGQTTSDFTARFGPRLTATDRTDGDAREFTVCLKYRGVDNTITVRNGALQQPPVDFRLIRRVFEETNGEFSLLDTDASSRDGIVLATVGCYIPPGYEDTLRPENIAAAPAEEP